MSEELKLKVGELTERGDFGRGIVRISAKDMKHIGISEGDIVELEGKRKTAAIAVRAYPVDIGLDIIRMDGLERRNCGSGVGESVKVKKAAVAEAKSVTIAPARKGIIIHMGGNLIKQNILMRPLMTGDIIIPNPIVQDRRSSSVFEQFFGMDFSEFIFTPFGEEKFVVVSTEPKGIVRVTRATDVELLPQITKPLEEERVPEVTYEDLGGLHEEVKKVREMIELPLKHPELFERLGIEPPKGILLHGPPGSGKTLLAKAVANESGAKFFVINGPEVMCVDGETEVKTTKGVKKAGDLYNEIAKNGKITERKWNLEVVVPDKDFFVHALDNKNKIVEDRIHHAFKLNADIYKIKLSNGSEVRGSDNQPLLVKRERGNEWVALKDLNMNEQAAVIGESGDVDFAEINSIEYLGEGEVFDFAINPYSNFIGGNPANVILHNSKFYGESLTPDETIFTMENGHASLQTIGDVVKSKTAEHVAEFDEKGRVEKGHIKSFMEHPFQKGKKIYEITTSTGRKIKVTDYHSLFALKDGKIADVKTSEVTSGDTYLAIPSRLPAPETYDTIDILKELADSEELNVRSPQIKNFIKKIGIKETAEILGVEEKYVYDIYGKNVCVSIREFLKLSKESGLPVDYTSADIVAKQNAGKLPAKINIDDDLATVIGLFLAEGSYTTKDAIRLTNELPETKEVVKRFCGKYGIKLTEYQDDMLFNSKPLKVVFEKILGIQTGAENKEITSKLMSMSLPLIKAMLRGYFTGDGSVYPPAFGRSSKTASYTRAHTIEGSTHSKKLANSLMYTLLYFGIVAKCSTKIEKYNGKLCYRVLIQSPEGFAKFSEIGFLDGKRNERISNYLNSKKFDKTQKIPIWPELRELIKSNQRLHAWSNSKTIGKDVLKAELVKIDPRKERHSDTWHVIDSDIVWDKVRNKEEIEYSGNVYDVSVNPNENFVAGFGGLFAHNSEENLRKIFEQAEKNAPSIVFIDEIDSIAPKREEVKGEVEKRVVSQLLCLDPKTLIYTPNGVLAIEDLYNKNKTAMNTKDGIEYTEPENLEVFGLKNSKIKPVKVKVMNKLHVPDTVEVSLDNGTHVTVSAIQRFMTVKHGKMAWQHVSNLKPGDAVALPAYLPEGSKVTFDIFKLDGDSYVLKIENELKKFFGSNYVKLGQLKKLYSESTLETFGLLRFRLVKAIHELKTFDMETLMRHAGVKNTYNNRVAVRRMLKNFIKIGTIKASQGKHGHGRTLTDVSTLPIFEQPMTNIAGIAHKKGSLFPIKEKYFVKPVLELSEDLAELLGYVLSDGSLSYNRVHVGGKPEIVDRAASIINELFGIKPFVGFDRIHRMDAGSITLANLMKDLYKIPSGKKAHIVKVPDYMYTVDRACAAKFVRAYVDCDGEIGKTKIRTFSRSREMMLGISRLLTVLSIPTTITKSNYDMWYCNVVGGYGSYVRFAQLVGSARPERIRKIENLLQRKRILSPQTTPEVEEQLYRLQKQHHVKIQDNDYRYLTGTANMTWDKFKYFVNTFDDDIDFDESLEALKEIKDAELRWVKIENIKKAEPMVMYDLTTETENFVGGELPVLLHNTLLDGLKARGKVIIIGATNIPNSLDPALRRPGRFDREIELGVPNKDGRKEILQIHTRGMPLEKNVDLNQIAEITYGYVGADISALCKEAAMYALRRVLPDIGSIKGDRPIPQDILKKLIVTKEDFDHAMKMVEPSAMREVLIEVPKVKWEDIGGLEEVKRSMKEVIEWPLKYPDSFKRLGIKPPTGVLLFGPPGCGKTQIAKAVANESGANFISVKGAELLSMWVGESEKHIRDVFRRAKQVAPAIIFFDEIDALVPRRGGYGADSHATERVVSQLLAEISGLEELHDVVVISASVTGDTPVLIKTKEGKIKLIPIEEFVDPFYYPGEEGVERSVTGFQCLGFDRLKAHAGLRFANTAFKNIRGVYRHKVNEIYEIEFLGGKVRATENHSVFIRTKQGIEARPVSSLKPGDYLVDIPYRPRTANGRQTRSNIFNKTFNLTLPIFESDSAAELAFEIAMDSDESQATIARHIGVSQTAVSKWQRGICVPRVLSKNYYKHKLPDMISVTPEIMRIFGYYTAEGYARKELDFCLNVKEHEFMSDIKQLMKNTFGIEPDKELVRDSAVNVIFYSKPLAAFFIRHCGKGAKRKHIPEFLFEAPREYFLEFLRGYANGDGHVTARGIIEITSVSGQLITELNWLCRMHGIKSSISKFTAKEGRRINNGKALKQTQAYRLTIPKHENPFNSTKSLPRAKRSVIKNIKTVPYEGYVYDLCGCDNEAFFGGKTPVLLHNTNRPDILDPALLRPGRFDRQILVPTPDEKSRLAILQVHTKDMPAANDVDLKRMAKEAVGYSGADLASLVREAGMHAMRRDTNAQTVTRLDFERALREIKPSVSEEMNQFYESILKKRKAQIIEEEINYTG